MAKTYTNEELNALVAEFSAEFDQLVKNEATRSMALRKDEGDDEPPVSEGSGSPEGSDSAPPAASASEPPASADPAASAPPADPASASADPAAASPDAASGGDPVEALKQAYAALPPEELQMHFLALKDVLQAQMAAQSPAPVPGAGAPPAASPGGMPPGGSPAPMPGEGSQPVDPAATMALKSEFEKELNLVKSERDAHANKVAQLEKSVEALTEAVTKVFSQPVRKSLTAKDVIGETLGKSEPDIQNLSKSEITKKLLTKARDESLKKSDRELINNYYKGTVEVEALAHLLG